MHRVQRGPLTGLIAQVMLLGGIAATVGLGPAGWCAGLTYGIVTAALLARGLRRAGAAGLGPADVVTLSRAVLVGGVTALVADGFARPAPTPVLVGLTAVALALDAVDGRVARRTGTVSAFGARFDMEVDAYLLLVLGAHLAPTVGGWVLAIGAMRYAFVAAGWALPWLRAPLPPRLWRKTIAATQGVALVTATAKLLAPAATDVLLAGALTLLVASFGRDVGWLWRRRPGGPVDRARRRALARSAQPPARVSACAGREPRT